MRSDFSISPNDVHAQKKTPTDRSAFLLNPCNLYLRELLAVAFLFFVAGLCVVFEYDNFTRPALLYELSRNRRAFHEGRAYDYLFAVRGKQYFLKNHRAVILGRNGLNF